VAARALLGGGEVLEERLEALAETRRPSGGLVSHRFVPRLLSSTRQQ
jgi:hypothetical protein